MSRWRSCPCRSPTAGRASTPSRARHHDGAAHARPARREPQPRRRARARVRRRRSGCPTGPRSATAWSRIAGFYYSRGNMLGGGSAARPPTLRPGQTLTFRNDDAPMDLLGGVVGASRDQAADLPHGHGVQGPLQPGHRHRLPARGRPGDLRLRASSAPGRPASPPPPSAPRGPCPSDLGRGTYTYFCRVHPYMRGAFRVKD